jgi:RES domain
MRLSPHHRPRPKPLPTPGVVRVHYDPGALPPYQDVVGPNRFDDPRPNSVDRYVMRYTASTLRGCLLELLDWLRPDPDALMREQQVADNAEDATVSAQVEQTAGDLEQAIADFLVGRHVGLLSGDSVQTLSIDDPALQAELDREPAVRALLDSPEGHAALSPAGRKPHLDQAAIRLSTGFGRDLTQACSLAIRDRVDRPDGIHYRSRHDDAEDCWALYDHASVQLLESVPLSPSDSDHLDALQEVAALWGLPLPREWI